MSPASQFQPLFPGEAASRPLLDLAAQLQTEASGFVGQSGPFVVATLRPLLRAMNSYYTNRIEGQHTHPADIERALRSEFDADATLARKQRLAVAHMEAEAKLEELYAGAAPAELFSAEVVLELHRVLYAQLSEDDRRTDEGDAIVPGRLREREVVVGNHLAPSHQEVADLLHTWAEGYRRAIGRDRLLVAVACSHHRLAWIHPFRDGNGRVARLHSHLLLTAMGLGGGLWSPMRGLARTRDQYYARLANADLPRRNDLDGRGALSEEELVAFATYFLERCLDQVRFLRTRLAFENFGSGLRQLLEHLARERRSLGRETTVVKIDCFEALHYCATFGPMDRSRFVAMTGLGERTGRRVLASLLHFGVLRSDTPKGAVSFALPWMALRFVFPGLWPEAEVE